MHYESLGDRVDVRLVGLDVARVPRLYLEVSIGEPDDSPDVDVFGVLGLVLVELVIYPDGSASIVDLPLAVAKVRVRDLDVPDLNEYTLPLLAGDLAGLEHDRLGNLGGSENLYEPVIRVGVLVVYLGEVVVLLHKSLNLNEVADTNGRRRTGVDPDSAPGPASVLDCKAVVRDEGNDSLGFNELVCVE